MNENGSVSRERCDDLLRAAVARGDVPCVAAMVTGRGGTIYEGAYGERLPGTGQPMTPDTVVLIQSMTKPITTAAALQLVEQGTFDLDADASAWAPRLADVQVLEGFEGDGRPRLRPPRRPITLRHLLTHTAGFGYEFWDAPIQRYQAACGVPSLMSGKLGALRTPLLFDPGARWHYGISTDWVGLMIEAATGRRLGDHMREALLEPLCMTSTAFTPTADMQSRFAAMHQRTGDGRLEPIVDDETEEAEFEGGGGGLCSTAADYLRFIRMILDKGAVGDRQVLQPSTAALMSTNQLGELPVTGFRTAMTSISNDVEFFPGLPKGWGLGFMINLERAPTGRTAGSLAWAGLANTYFWIDPAEGIGGVFMTQILPFADTMALPLYLGLETTVYDSLG